MTVHFRPKRLTLKGYKQYWFKFQDTSMSYFKSKEESIGEPIQQINLKGTEFIIVFSSTKRQTPSVFVSVYYFYLSAEFSQIAMSWNELKLGPVTIKKKNASASQEIWAQWPG